MEVAGESRGVARGPFKHPGIPKESPKQPSGALGGVRDVLRCFAIDFKNIKNVICYTVFCIMKLHLGLIGYALWEKERLNAFTRS